MSENDVSAEAAHSSNKPARVILNETDLENITVSELATRWRQQDHYLNSLEQRLGQLEGETTSLRESDEKHKALYAESQQREKVLVRRLAAKEQEMQDYVCQLADLKSSQGPNNSSLRSTLLDPSVNCLLQLLRQELVTTRSRLEETQNELSAWKFTPDSNTGKRLMAKCRLLYQENEELGKMTSSGRLAKLEGELALQKRISEEFKKSQTELEEYLQDLDEDVEGMQSTILYLQQELRKSNDLVVALQTENGQLRNVRVNGTTGHGENNSVCNNDESINIRTPNSADSSESFENNSKVTSSDKSTNNLCNDNNDTDNGNSNQIKRQFESDNGREELRTRTNKKVRRSSVLSIDYNDDDALVISTNGDANISDAE